MENSNNTNPESNLKPGQDESIFEVLERLNKDLDETARPELPAIMINVSDHCQSCGS